MMAMLFLGFCLHMAYASIAYDGNVIFRLLFAREVIVGSVACQAVIAVREKILKLQLMY